MTIRSAYCTPPTQTETATQLSYRRKPPTSDERTQGFSFAFFMMSVTNYVYVNRVMTYCWRQEIGTRSKQF